MGTFVTFLLLSAISFIVYGLSEISIESSFPDHFVDNINLSREFSQFSGIEKSCANESATALYNHLTRVGDEDDGMESITIGFLGAYGATQVVLGALPLAVEAVNEDSDLLPGRRLNFVAGDIGTNAPSSSVARSKSSLAAQAIKFMTEMRDNGTIAFIGPDDTCFSEALVAAAWNLPMISYKCSDTRVSDKRIFYTFARTLPPSSKVSKSVVALLRAFDWHRFVVVSGEHPASGSEVKEAIEELSSYYGLIVTDTKQYTNYIPRYIEQMDNIVSDTFERTRVYVFVGEHIALIDFVKCLQRRGLLDGGQYVVISVDDEIYDPNRRINIVRRDYLDPFLNETWANGSDLMGFRSVLKLTPSHPRNPDYSNSGKLITLEIGYFNTNITWKNPILSYVFTSAHSHLKLVELKMQSINSIGSELCERIKAISIKSPFCVPYHPKIFDSISVPIQAAYLYDAVMIYARALTEVLKSDEDPKNGTALLKRIVNRYYHSIQGYDVFIDGNGDAEGNFTVVALLDDTDVNGSILSMSMQPVGYFQYNPNSSSTPYAIPEFRYFDSDRTIQWVGGKLPVAEPACGFYGEKCISKPNWKLIISMTSAASLVVVCVMFAVKHYRYEQKLACLLWKIEMKDVTIIPTETNERSSKSMIQTCRYSLFQAPTGSIADISDTSPKRAYTKIGLYKGNIVAIKFSNRKSFDLTRSIRKELKQVREIRHENLIPFIGASVDPGNMAIFTAYCARGSLEDVLANEDMRLDNMFISSLVTDILKGMIYLHDSEIISHGNLRPSNCLIDSRWVLQISDFGLHEFKGISLEPDGKELDRALYKAPELLRHPSPPPRGTQKGDVYSFGIILYEILGRSGPWGLPDLSPLEIINRVKKTYGDNPFRPPLGQLDAAEYIIKCIKACWHEDPDQRPDIRYVRVRLKEMQAGLKPNIFDNMLAIMEKYAYNLEGLVQERTNQLTEEKKKTDALLHRMLPKPVAESLKRGDQVEAEIFDCVTIYFSDIVGFTELSANSTPLQVIDLLNDLYTCFDSIISHYDVYKVETIGDAYMVASGLPIRHEDKHAGEIASMALHLLSKIKKFKIKHMEGEVLQLRIGIHSGDAKWNPNCHLCCMLSITGENVFNSYWIKLMVDRILPFVSFYGLPQELDYCHCVAGVVGLKMPRYCLFGDTVNTASRMESSGEAFKIHISYATHALLQKLGGYKCEERGVIPIKGKGEMRTYWLISEDPSKRLARLRDEIVGSSLFSSISSELLSETPDLLRGPDGVSLGYSMERDIPSRSVCPLFSLHQRARLAWTMHQSQDDFQKNQLHFCQDLSSSHGFVPKYCHRTSDSRNPRSAPVIKFSSDSKPYF